VRREFLAYDGSPAFGAVMYGVASQTRGSSYSTTESALAGSSLAATTRITELGELVKANRNF
jgi:hypothetical protein